MTEEFPGFHAREQHGNEELRAIAAELHQLARTVDVKLDLVLAQGEEDSKRIEELEKLLDERWQHLLHRRWDRGYPQSLSGDFMRDYKVF
jgi:hypothetical protein